MGRLGISRDHSAHYLASGLILDGGVSGAANPSATLSLLNRINGAGLRHIALGRRA